MSQGTGPAGPLPLQGDRVALRRLAAADLAVFQHYRSDPELARFQGWSAQSDADALAFIEEMAALPLFVRGDWVQLAIADRASDTLIGDIGLHVDAEGRSAEIGFTLCRPAQGRGLGGEAVALALQLLQEHGAIERVTGMTDARNLASVRLLERLGFRHCETRATVYKGEPCVEQVYVRA